MKSPRGILSSLDNLKNKMGWRPRRSSFPSILGTGEAWGGMRLKLLRLKGKGFTGKTVSQRWKLPSNESVLCKDFLVFLNEDGKSMQRIPEVALLFRTWEQTRQSQKCLGAVRGTVLLLALMTAFRNSYFSRINVHLHISK